MWETVRCWGWVGTLGLLSAVGCGEPASHGPSDASAEQGPLPPSACSQRVGGNWNEPEPHVLRYESETPRIRVHLRRQFVEQAAGESVIYALRGMWVERDGMCTAMVEPGELEYENTHHNWDDRAAGIYAGLRHEVFLPVRPEQQVVLSITSVSTGAPILDPVAMRNTGSSSFGGVVIVTELMVDNNTAWRDDAGEADPWIELRVWDSLDLSGYFLSNDPERREQWAFPTGTVVPVDGRLVLAADGDVGQGPLHTNFRLAPGPGAIVLTAPDGTTPGERVYPALPAGHSAQFSRMTDQFELNTTPTPGSGTD